MTDSATIKLCDKHQLTITPEKSFTVNGKKIFVIYKNNQLFAYENNCPHLEIPLDWDNDAFLDNDKELIQCATHGALFLMHWRVCKWTMLGKIVNTGSALRQKQ